MERMMRKKAIFFTIDALVATAIILIGLLLIPGLYFNKQPTVHLSYISQDFVNILSELKIYELDSLYVDELIANGNIIHINNTILEQIGEFWAEGNDEIASNFTKEIVDGIVPEGFGYGIWVGDEEIYSVQKPVSSVLISSRKIISGYAKMLPVLGYSSRVYLSSLKERQGSSITYFGGFVGEGNISAKIFLPQNITNITGAYWEVLIGTDSKFYINGNYSGSYPKGSGNGTYIVPSIWRINSTYYKYFHPGENNISIKFEYINENFTASGPAYLGGGYFKVSYFTPDIEELGTTYYGSMASKRYWFPNIRGFINHYSSIYVPGNLSSMKIYLNFFSNYTTYLNIGGVDVYEEKTDGFAEVTLTESQLQTIFSNNGIDYGDDFSLTTIPIRLGLKNITRTSAPLDAVLITDVSGSMRWRMNQDSVNGVQRNCDDSDLNNLNTERLSVAKCAGKDFIDTILDNQGPLIGLVSYESSTDSTLWLTENKTALYDEINGYSASGGTCVCCGVNEAVNMLKNDTQAMFIPRKTGEWKYNDDDLGSDPSGWTALGFNDSLWSSGSAALGNGYSDLNTVINKYEGYYYFRKKFNATNISDFNYAKLTVYSDDGADIYLNGNLVDNDLSSAHTAEYWNRYVNIDPGYLQEGENIVAVKLKNSGSCWFWFCWDRNPVIDLEFFGSSQELVSGAKKKAIIIMTDGEANYECDEQGNSGDLNNDGQSDTAKDDAIKAACDAYDNYGITVYAVGFSTFADSSTLQYMSNCTDGNYFSSTNYEELRDTYLLIIDQLIDFTETQRVNDTDIIPTEIFMNSYIEFNYTPEVPAPSFGQIPVTGETSKFGNTISRGNLIIPEGDTLVELVATSYSADKWTDIVTVNNSGDSSTVFNLSKFGSSYRHIGDAFNVYVPSSKIIIGEQNTISVSTAIAPENVTGGSEYNRLIFKARIDSLMDYGSVYAKSEGCIWFVAFEDDANVTVKIPSAYNGTDTCYYANQTYESNDVMDDAAYRLFRRLDFDLNGKLEVKLDENNLAIDTLTVADVPSLWGPAIMEVRLW